MIRGFTFERALSWPFTAPHAASFPWIFGAAYAAAMILTFGLIGWLSAGDVTAWINGIEVIDETVDPDAQFGAVMSSFGRLVPWMALTALASWVLWAMFETASQRRYIWGKGFSLGFGADELRMMAVGFCWSLVGFLLMALPALLIMGSAIGAMVSGTASSRQIETMMFGAMAGVFGLMLLILPLYVFFATRLAPCFSLTVMQKRFRFLDAWNVSRGRFWPILGAYVILAIAGSIIAQVISGIAQMIIMPGMINFAQAAETGADIRGLILSPQFIAPLGLYGFIILFLQGLLQHIVGGPAAFATRHDPRGGVEEAGRIDVFS